MEKYLYFCETTTAPSTATHTGLYPTTSVTAVEAASITSTTVVLVPRDGTRTSEDKVTLTHASGDHKNVMADIAACVNSGSSSGPFIEVADRENNIFNVRGVTGVQITTAD